MTTQIQPASEGELVTFLEKLAQFHGTLSPREQALLDEMTATALIAPQLSQEEVQGYTSGPTYYQTFLTLNQPGSAYYSYYSAVGQYYNTLGTYYKLPGFGYAR
ncbi:MAG TPA: hypothetical protein VKV26_03440 [Dehalococcoidia bacterium]|nr:hypothetical protein [Dehalococcoidia bacterium]